MSFQLVTLAFLLPFSDALAPHRVAIVTGGTRGIGRGISEALAGDGYDLLLTYNANSEAAEQAALQLREAHADCTVAIVGGDISLPVTRDAVFACFDEKFKSSHDLGAVVHNAGQYIGVTSSNAAGLEYKKGLFFGDGSLLGDDEQLELDTMRYYQKLYGEAFIDLCERGLTRMTGTGSLIGVSNPGCAPGRGNPQPGYDMPGSGKTMMEYAMRLIALRCAARGINCNLVVPGVTETEAWGKLAAMQGSNLPTSDPESRMNKVAAMIAPMGAMTPAQMGGAVAFLCSPRGRIITGVSLPVDGGVHLKT